MLFPQSIANTSNFHMVDKPTFLMAKGKSLIQLLLIKARAVLQMSSVSVLLGMPKTLSRDGRSVSKGRPRHLFLGQQSPGSVCAYQVPVPV